MIFVISILYIRKDMSLNSKHCHMYRGRRFKYADGMKQVVSHTSRTNHIESHERAYKDIIIHRGLISSISPRKTLYFVIIHWWYYTYILKTKTIIEIYKHFEQTHLSLSEQIRPQTGSQLLLSKWSSLSDRSVSKSPFISPSAINLNRNIRWLDHLNWVPMAVLSSMYAHPTCHQLPYSFKIGRQWI